MRKGTNLQGVGEGRIISKKEGLPRLRKTGVGDGDLDEGGRGIHAPS